MSIPSRLSEETFRFYEPYIAEAVDKFPVAIAIDPDEIGRSHATIQARLRDAMISLEQYDWETIIDVKAFRQLRKQRKIRVRDLPYENRYLITIGGPAGFQVFHVNKPIVRQDEFQISEYDRRVAQAVMTLKLRNIIPNPFRFINLSVEDLEELVEGITETGHDHVVENGQVIIL